MKKNTLNDHGCMIYPGAYVPLLNVNEVQWEVEHSLEVSVISPQVNVTELPDFFRIEVAIPGVKREDFTVYTEENTLSVSVVNKESASYANNSIQSNEFNYNCFNHKLDLPDNVDCENIHAEYNSGILCLYVPKQLKSEPGQRSTIIVY